MRTGPRPTVELAVRSDLSGNLESNGDECLADGVVEHRLAVGAVLVEGCRKISTSTGSSRISLPRRTLVDDIPAGTSVLVPSGHVRDVVPHNLNQGFVVEVTLADPSRQLAVPDHCSE